MGRPDGLQTKGRTAEDQRLLDLWNAGDENAFESIFRKYQKRIYTLALRYTGSVSDAEDIAAETFARAYRHLRGQRSGAMLMPWLFRVTTNQCRDYGRRRTTRKTSSYTTEREGSMGDLATSMPDPRPQPHAVAAASETRKAVAMAVGKLPEWQREVVLLFYLEDQCIDDVASTLGISKGTVKSRLFRAREALKAFLGPHVLPEESGNDE